MRISSSMYLAAKSCDECICCPPVCCRKTEISAAMTDASHLGLPFCVVYRVQVNHGVREEDFGYTYRLH